MLPMPKSFGRTLGGWGTSEVGRPIHIMPVSGESCLRLRTPGHRVGLESELVPRNKVQLQGTICSTGWGLEHEVQELGSISWLSQNMDLLRGGST